jgi:hypothetical protein
LPDEFPSLLIAGLQVAIADEQQAPLRKDVIKMLREVRATGKFDEADPLQVGLLEPDFSDRYSRTPQRVRKNADRLLKDYRRERPGKHGRGSGRYFVRPDGIAAPTLCALIISIKFGWPAVTNGQVQEACEKLWAAAGGNVQRRGGACDRKDGFCRDHLRDAQQWRDEPIARRIQSAL